jgi:DNA polymerase-3 subunit delta'
MRGRRKVAIIDDPPHLNQEGANCLLKTLEEPPPRSIIILIGTSALRQLPTIRSRSQIVRFAPLSNESVERLLVERQLVENRADATELARLSDGSIERALALADPEVREFRASLLENLGEQPLNSVALAKTVGAFVDAAGKEAPPRRERLKQVLGWSAEYYRQAMWRGVGSDTRANSRGANDPEIAADSLEWCIEAAQYVDANANQTTLIDAWLSRLRN